MEQVVRHSHGAGEWLCLCWLSNGVWPSSRQPDIDDNRPAGCQRIFKSFSPFCFRTTYTFTLVWCVVCAKSSGSTLTLNFNFFFSISLARLYASSFYERTYTKDCRHKFRINWTISIQHEFIFNHDTSLCSSHSFSLVIRCILTLETKLFVLFISFQFNSFAILWLFIVSFIISVWLCSVPA